MPKIGRKQELLLECIKEKIDGNKIFSLNAPRTEEYVMNNRGEKLHIRTDWSQAFNYLGLKQGEDTSSGKKNALIVIMHGMGGHNNRPAVVHNASYYIAKGYKVCAFDFHGHGYSNNFMPVAHDCDVEKAELNREEERKGPMKEFESNRNLIKHWEHLLDDLTCVLRALYSDGDREVTDVESKVPEHKLFIHASRDMPFFLTGTSMGGAVTLMMGSILHKITKTSGRGLCGGGLPSAYCDEDYLEKYGPGADGGLRKTCLVPVLDITGKVSSALLEPFISNSTHIISRATSVFTTPVARNSLLVGEENDATAPGSDSNLRMAAETGVGPTHTEEGQGVNKKDESSVEMSSPPDSARLVPSPEERIGLPFLDASLLPIARMCIGVVLMSPAISVSNPHPILRTTLEAIVAPLLPSMPVPDMFRKSVDASATWVHAEYREYCLHDAFPKGLSYDTNKNIRFGTAATMLKFLDAVTLEIPDMQIPFLCIMDPEDKVVSVDGVKVLMEKCGENHRMFRDDVDESEYEVAASASAAQPVVNETSEDVAKEAPEKRICGILKENEYGTFVALPGAAHGCLENDLDAVFEATNNFFDVRLAKHGESDAGGGAIGRVDL